MLGTTWQAGNLQPGDSGSPVLLQEFYCKNLLVPSADHGAPGPINKGCRFTRSSRVSFVPELYTSAWLGLGQAPDTRVLRRKAASDHMQMRGRQPPFQRQWLPNHQPHHIKDFITRWPAYLPKSTSLSRHFHKEIKWC